ncbi:hypothetical protein MXB_2444, partial [Myxobolus squamalis]
MRRARHISGLISSISALSVGTTLSITEDSFSVAFNNLIRSFRKLGKNKIFSKEFYEHLRTTADPITTAVLVEDLVAIAGIGIAIICIFLSQYFSISFPDSVGSILIGSRCIYLIVVLLGFSAYLLSKRNIKFLLEKSFSLFNGRSIHRSRLEAIVDTINSDKLVRSVHDVKATMIGDGTVKFKAEINYDGAELAKAYLYLNNSTRLLKKAQKIKTPRQLNNFTIYQTVQIMDCLGVENDRIERKLK